MAEKDKKNINKKQDAPEFDLSSAPSFIRKPIQWFKNYWYYYRMHFVLIVPMVIVVIVLILSFFNKKSYDYTAVLCAGFTVESEDLDKISENLTQYLGDANGDGKLDIGMAELTLMEDLDDEYYAQNYNKLSQMIVFDEVVFFIADDYSYEYLKSHGFIEPFSRIGAGGDDEFALDIKDSGIFDGTMIENFAEWHLLVKVKNDIHASDKVYAARRDMLTAMIESIKAK